MIVMRSCNGSNDVHVTSILNVGINLMSRDTFAQIYMH